MHERIVAACRGITPQTLLAARRSLHVRLLMGIAVDGKHIEHMLDLHCALHSLWFELSPFLKRALTRWIKHCRTGPPVPSAHCFVAPDSLSYRRVAMPHSDTDVDIVALEYHCIPADIVVNEVCVQGTVMGEFQIQLRTTTAKTEGRAGFVCVSGLTPYAYKEGKSCKETCIAAKRDWAAMACTLGPCLPPFSVLRARLNYEEQGKNRQERRVFGNMLFVTVEKTRREEAGYLLFCNLVRTVTREVFGRLPGEGSGAIGPLPSWAGGVQPAAGQCWCKHTTASPDWTVRQLRRAPALRDPTTPPLSISGDTLNWRAVFSSLYVYLYGTSSDDSIILLMESLTEQPSSQVCVLFVDQLTDRTLNKFVAKRVHLPLCNAIPAPPMRVKRGQVWSSTRNEGARKAGEPRESQLVSGIVRHEAHRRTTEGDPTGN
ncbi:hypothetical protein PR048_022141 [Dryococelus australis]|uniref:Uncharacterized protein n=1 Tax=Dryococelus australis TaxID=614101 RepID=A0ABQ9H0F2_9NEOP|nr:hypothetical protein PR048_022141 [Dryococelus australis]